MFSPSTRTLAGLLLLLLAGLLVYYPALDRVFVYDDILTVRDNDFITHPGNLLHLSGEDYLRAAGERTYRPLVTATYILDCMVWGKAPFGFGLTNLLLHVLAAWLLALVLLRVVGDPLLVWSASLLFLWHPASVEAVISPGNREEVLSVLLALLCVYAYLRGRDGARAWRMLAPIALTASLFTMEWGVMLLPVLALWAYYRGDNWRAAIKSMRWLVATTAIYLLLYLFVLPRLPGETPWLGGSRGQAFLAFGKLFWSYVRIAVLPLNLRPSYTYSASALWVSLLGWAALLAVIGIAAYGLVRRRNWALGVALFGLALAPVGHLLMPFWIPMAERYLYLPLAGGAPLITAFYLRRDYRRLGLVLVSAVAVAFAYGAAQRAREWKTPLDLWSKAVTVEPHDPVSWTNIAAGLAAYGLHDQAVEAHKHAWEEAVAKRQANADHWINVLTAMQAAGRNEQACRLTLDEKASFDAQPQDRLNLALAQGEICSGVDRNAAHDFFGRALQLESGNCRAWAGFCATDALNMAGCLREAARICPQNGYVLLQIAALHAYTGDAEKMGQAVRLASQSPQWPQLREAALTMLRGVKK